MISLYTIADLRTNSCFDKNCEVYCSVNANLKPVSWLLFLEPAEISSYPFKGGEFVFVNSASFSREYRDDVIVDMLIGANASGLCVFNTSIYHKISSSLVKHANENDFAIVVINEPFEVAKTVREINQMILGSQGEEILLEKTELYYRNLLEMEEKSSIQDYLAFTSEYLGVETGYWHILSEPVCTGNFDIRSFLTDIKEIYDLPEKELYHKGGLYLRAIRFLVEPYSFIYLYSERELTEFEIRILDKLWAFLRNKDVSAFITRLQREHRESDWINYLLDGKLGKRFVLEKLKKERNIEPAGFVVVTVRIPAGKERTYDYFKDYREDRRIVDDLMIETGMFIYRSFIFQGFAGYPNIAKEDLRLLKCIFIAPKEMKDWRERYFTVIDRLNANPAFLKGHSVKVGFASCSTIQEIPRAGRNAEYCRDITLTLPFKCVAFEKLHLLKALEAMRVRYELDDYIEGELKDLAQEENRELLEVLKTYYANGCEKKKTAEALYMTRQTLYARLEKIEEILGEGYDREPVKTAINLALEAILYR